jgi:uncharacterized RDD family membrane protein YckC
MARLIVNPTSASRRELPLESPALSIGRDPANDLVLPDAMVSRRHAVIEQRGVQFFLRDCNSSNGSLVNGDRVSECGLKDGDLVAIGTTRLLFRDDVEVETGGQVVPHPHAHLVCPACQAEHRVGDQFCRQCGQQLTPLVSPKMLCPACGTVVSLPAKFCSVCGTVLPRASQELETTKPQPRLEDEGPAGPVAAPPPPLAAAVVSRPAARPVAPPRPVLPSALARAPRAGQPRAGRPTNPDDPRPANPLLRLLAALIDSALVGVGEGLLLGFVAAFWWNRTEAGYLPILLSVLLVCLALLLGALYFVFFWGVQGATPGKKALGLMVVDLEGRSPIGVGPALLRLLGYSLSGLPLGLGFLLVPLTGRGLHDRMAGTLVVEREKD